MEAISGAAPKVHTALPAARMESRFLPRSFPSPDIHHTGLSASGLCLSPHKSLQGRACIFSISRLRETSLESWLEHGWFFATVVKKGALRAGRLQYVTPKMYSQTAAFPGPRWTVLVRAAFPFPGEALSHKHEAPWASQSCPSPRTWLPWAALVGGTGTSRNVLSQAGQEGVGGLFLRCQTFTLLGLGCCLLQEAPWTLAALGLLPTLSFQAFSFLPRPALADT